MDVLVVGATGYVGTVISEALGSAGHKVIENPPEEILTISASRGTGVYDAPDPARIRRTPSRLAGTSKP